MANLDSQIQTTAFIFAVLAFAVAAWQAFVTLRRAAHSPTPGVDWPLALFAVITGTIILAGWVATLLASIGWFSLAACAALLYFFAALCFAAARRAHRADLPVVPFSAPGIQEVGLGLLLVVAAFLYFRPHEYVLGGTDAGTYLNMAVSTASTGEFLYHDEWTGLLAKHRDNALREQPEPLLTRSLQFVGWYIDDADPTISRPQFFPFHPMLLALATSLGGPAAALWVTPLWGVLDIAALYFLARTLFDKNVALLAALFLTLTPTQIFFARYPTTEPLTLLLLFVALLAFQLIWDDERRSIYWGLLGGAALGAALLTRIDLPVVLAFVVLGMGVRAWQRRWSGSWTSFGLTLGIFLIHMVLSITFLNWPYFWNTYLGVFLAVQRGVGMLVAAAVLAIFILVAALIAGPRRVRYTVRRMENSMTLRWVLATATVALSAYAYFLRPALEPATYTTSWPAYVEFPILNGQNWLRMGWYLTPFGLLLATAGLAVVFLRASLTRIAIVLGIGLFTTVQYIYNVLNTPYHIYTMRRYVPIVIPMLLLFAAVAILSIPMVRRRWITYTLRFSAVALLVGGLLYQARFVLPQQDMAGSLAQLDALEDRLAPDAVIVIADPSTSTFADTFGVPLQFQYGHNIATLRTETADTPAYLQDVQDWAAKKNIPVQVLAQEPLLPSVRDTLRLQPRSLYPFTVDMLMNTFDSFPSVVQSIHYGLQIYDIEGGHPKGNGPLLNSNTPVDESFVDIGGLDAIYIVDGFYFQENPPGGPTVRWTAARSSVEIPLPAPLTTEPGNEAMLEVQAMIFRPEGVPPHPVTVRLNGQDVGQFTPTAEWETYSYLVKLSQATDEPALLEFETEPFVPIELGVNADTRSLGFLIDWIRLGPLEE